MPSLNHGYWKTLAELDRGNPSEPTPDDREEALVHADAPIDPLSRRNFVQLMGASFALAGIAGCKRYDREEIVPLSRRPEDMTPGVTQQYASSFELSGHAQALLVTSYEGRPIHIDGNPEHPFAGSLEERGTNVIAGTKSRGASSMMAQGSILHLYDPDRSQAVSHAGKGATFEDFRAWIGELRKTSNPSRIRILAEATSSPTVQALRRRLADQLPGVGWHEWEPVSFDNERAGMQQAFGRPVRALASLDQAETIVSFDCDFFREHPAALRYARDFSRSHRGEGSSLGPGHMSRLWVVESSLSSAGVLADHRWPLRAEHVLAFVQQLDAMLIPSGGVTSSSKVVDEPKLKDFIAVLVEEIKANAGRVVFLAGRKQPPLVHALCAKLNQQFSGGKVVYLDDPDPVRPTHSDAITGLRNDIQAKQVDTLFIVGGNPVYDAPADLDFASLLATVPTSVHLAEYLDETSKKTTWHVPKAHYLESWGDARTWDGTYTVQQPLIAPMYGGISTIELVALLLGDDTAADKLVQHTFEQSGAGGTWRAAVCDGFVDKTQLAPQTLPVNPLARKTLEGTAAADSAAQLDSLEVTFSPSHSVWDGRFANNPWLQETPEFLTKVVWDTVALIAPDTAEHLHISSEDMLRIKLGDRTVDVPALVMPGQAKGSIGLWLGGGRTAAGKVGNKGGVDHGGGFDCYKLRTTAGLDFISGATVSKHGGKYKICTTQDHFDIRRSGFSIEDDIGDKGAKEREHILVREVEKDTLVGDPGYKAEEESRFFYDHEHHRGYSLYEEHEYKSHRWAMAIDLGSCMGCNACVTACQSENNVPTVGKKQVATNREMSWIRIDRYFKGDFANPEVVGQPIACQHCENAPCETVCPVGATLHSSEGINEMVYNRCIGTRYCLNNCPYRVRRFNFLFWHKEFEDARNKVKKLLFNPDVTVRERGVMEKCTYCIQRIQNAKIKAKNAHNRGIIEDGIITTACQAACPTEAIVFGDLMDPDSRVSRMHADRRQYELLGDLNDKPRTRFLARVRNPNTDPRLASAAGHHE